MKKGWIFFHSFFYASQVRESHSDAVFFDLAVVSSKILKLVVA
jgi:hypothetical protein